MDTVKDMMERIQTMCSWVVHHGMDRIKIPALVINGRINYGQPQYEIEVHGERIWVNESSIIWEVEQPEDEDTGWPLTSAQQTKATAAMIDLVKKNVDEG